MFEYLQEVQVKTSGISAEYGGALGGVVSAVTKSGGNTFRGETHYFYEGSALAAAPVKRLVLDPSPSARRSYVQDQENPSTQQEFGGSVGGPIVRDRLFFYGLVSLRATREDERLYCTRTAPATIDREIWRQQAFGKMTYSTRRLNANWSALWTPTEATGTLAGYNGTTPNSQNTTARHSCLRSIAATRSIRSTPAAPSTSRCRNSSFLSFTRRLFPRSLYGDRHP